MLEKKEPKNSGLPSEIGAVISKMNDRFKLIEDQMKLILENQNQIFKDI